MYLCIVKNIVKYVDKHNIPTYKLHKGDITAINIYLMHKIGTNKSSPAVINES